MKTKQKRIYNQHEPILMDTIKNTRKNLKRFGFQRITVSNNQLDQLCTEPKKIYLIYFDDIHGNSKLFPFSFLPCYVCRIHTSNGKHDRYSEYYIKEITDYPIKDKIIQGNNLKKYCDSKIEYYTKLSTLCNTN